MATDTVPAEIIFAQHLAANEKVNRDRALRKLQKYIHDRSSLPNGGFNETELLKIWKGLHYCMWMQDKPLVQEELSANVAQLIHSFNSKHAALLFIKTFYITECREWQSIDKWRMDKFLMMFRNMLTESLEFIKKHNWSEKLISDYLTFLSDYIILDEEHAHTPDGVKFHLVDTYLVELEAVSKGKLGPKQTVTFIQPWITMLITIKNLTLRAHVIKNIFGELLQRSSILSRVPRTKDSTTLRVHYSLAADRLFEAGSSENCTTVNRPIIYSLVQNYRDVSQGKLPFNPEEQSRPDVKDLDEDDMEAALKRLTALEDGIRQENEQGKKLKKRKRQIADVDEAYGSGSSQDEEQAPPAIPVKKSKMPKATKNKQERNKPKVLSKKLKQIIQLEEEIAGRSQESEEIELADDITDQDMEPEAPDQSEECEPVDIPAEPEKKVTKKARRKSKAGKKQAESKILESESGYDLTKKSTEAQQLDAHVSTDPAEQTKGGDTGRKRKSKGKKKTKAASVPDFEVADFPDSEDLYAAVESTETSIAVESTETSLPNSMGSKEMNVTPKKSKKNPRKSVTADVSAKKTPAPKADSPSVRKGTKPVPNVEASTKLAEFSWEGVTKAKYLKKATSKSLPSSPRVAARTPKTPDSAAERRISFGKSSSVKKTEVKLKGRLSHDPRKTPEQSILKVNPIQPGTVIQVGKQATLQNTLNNSKFPHRMMASDFF